MKKKSSINTKIIALLMAIIIFAVWLTRVVYVNATAPQTEYEYYNIGDAFEYKGNEIKVLGIDRYTLEEFSNEFKVNASALGFNIDNPEYFLCVAKIEITKIQDWEEAIKDIMDQSLYFGWFNIKLVCLADSYISTPEIEMKMQSSITKKLGAMKINDTETVDMVFPVYYAEMDKKYYENFEDYMKYIQFEDYMGHEKIIRVRSR